MKLWGVMKWPVASVSCRRSGRGTDAQDRNHLVSIKWVAVLVVTTTKTGERKHQLEVWTFCYYSCCCNHCPPMTLIHCCRRTCECCECCLAVHCSKWCSIDTISDVFCHATSTGLLDAAVLLLPSYQLLPVSTSSFLLFQYFIDEQNDHLV